MITYFEEKSNSTPENGPKTTFLKGGTRPWMSPINIVFFAHLIVVGLVVVGVLPRGVVLGWTVALAAYVLWATLEDATAFFVRSIPFFVAIPVTAGFDSFNMWRVLSGLIFLKWLAKSNFQFFKSPWYFLCGRIKSTMGNASRMFNGRSASFLVICLLALAILSIVPAQSPTLAIKRIIYFVNLSLIGVVIYDLVQKNQDFSQRLIKNIAIPTIIVAVIGMVQQVSTYFMDIFQFVDFWGGVVERNLFGSAWAEIAIKANTWFAYYGEQLSLRMFSIFPDSHSFPVFLLLGLPAVMALSLQKIFQNPTVQGSTSNSWQAGYSLRQLFKIRASWLVIFVPVIFLAMILTGTRGIWAAGAVVSILSIIFIFWLRSKHSTFDIQHSIFGYLALYLVIFFLLFGPAYYILATNQFQMQKGDTALLAKRVRSLIDISETSNARRIEIWKDSIRSIIKYPLLGVGIGNFPVVVGEDLARAKAGSSAHNLYLHIAAELGIPALLFALWFLWLLLKRVYCNYLVASRQSLVAAYFGSLLIFLPWVLMYSLTDIALFDERAFLLFMVTVALVFGVKQNRQEAT